MERIDAMGFWSLRERPSFLVTAVCSIAIGPWVYTSVGWSVQEENTPPAPPLIKRSGPAKKLDELRGDPLMQIIEQRLTPDGAPMDDKPRLLKGPIDLLDRRLDGKEPEAVEPKPADGDKTANRPMRLKRDNLSSKQSSVGQLRAAEGMIRSARQLEKEAERAERAGQPERAKAMREIGSSIQRDVVKLLQLGS